MAPLDKGNQVMVIISDLRFIRRGDTRARRVYAATPHLVPFRRMLRSRKAKGRSFSASAIVLLISGVNSIPL